MKTIGLIGGMSWESSLLYYEYINKKVKLEQGGFHSAKCILNSVDFAEIANLQANDDWKALDRMMIKSAIELENAGADIILICANTMHLCYDAIVKNTNIPCLHIAKATGGEIAKKSLSKVALLGTKFTMERDFYKNRLTNDFKIEVMVPNQEARDQIHDIIYEELVFGVINPESKDKYKVIIDDLTENGAEGIILGCTEIPLLISTTDVSVPLFNTTKIHAEKAVHWAIE